MKKWIWIAGGLMGVGMLVGGIGLAISGGDFSEISNLKRVTRQEELESFHSIDMDLGSGDVRILSATDGRYSVYLKESDLLYHNVEVKDGVLKIEQKDARKWYQRIGVSVAEMEVTLYLPTAEYSSWQIDANGGDIQLLTGADEAGVRLHTSSGDITVENAEFKTLAASASSGEIEIKSVAAEHISVKTQSGDADLENTACDNLLVDVASGNIDLENVRVLGESNLCANSGDVKLSACDSGSYIIETGSGNVKGSILTAKVFDAKAGSGSVRVPASGSGGVCKVRTGSGNIRLWLYGE